MCARLSVLCGAGRAAGSALHPPRQPRWCCTDGCSIPIPFHTHAHSISTRVPKQVRDKDVKVKITDLAREERGEHTHSVAVSSIHTLHECKHAPLTELPGSLQPSLHWPLCTPLGPHPPRPGNPERTAGTHLPSPRHTHPPSVQPPTSTAAWPWTTTTRPRWGLGPVSPHVQAGRLLLRLLLQPRSCFGAVLTHSPLLHSPALASPALACRSSTAATPAPSWTTRTPSWAGCTARCECDPTPVLARRPCSRAAPCTCNTPCPAVPAEPPIRPRAPPSQHMQQYRVPPCPLPCLPLVCRTTLSWSRASTWAPSHCLPA